MRPLPGPAAGRGFSRDSCPQSRIAAARQQESGKGALSAKSSCGQWRARASSSRVSDAKPRRALVLSGGGSKGAFEVGVLQRLMGDERTDYDLLCGTSVGAINASYLAQTPLGQPREAAAKLRALWDTVTTDKVRKSWFPFGRVSAFFKTSVYDSSPLQAWIRSGLDAAAVRV